jgi:hypothetical protein
MAFKRSGVRLPLAPPISPGLSGRYAPSWARISFEHGGGTRGRLDEISPVGRLPLPQAWTGRRSVALPIRLVCAADLIGEVERLGDSRTSFRFQTSLFDDF